MSRLTLCLRCAMLLRFRNNSSHMDVSQTGGVCPGYMCRHKKAEISYTESKTIEMKSSRGTLNM